MSRHAHATGASNIKHDTDIHLLLERGRRFTIDQEGRRWDAVYWGSDESGDIVCYHSENRWNFIHFDIRRVAESLIVGSLLSVSEIRVIERQVTAHLGN